MELQPVITLTPFTASGVEDQKSISTSWEQTTCRTTMDSAIATEGTSSDHIKFNDPKLFLDCKK